MLYFMGLFHYFCIMVLLQYIRQYYLLLGKSLLRNMKKFLHLKQSIIESKNQPSVLQTYLDTIRSSCYKLASPPASFRSSHSSSVDPEAPTYQQQIQNQSPIHHKQLYPQTYLTQKYSQPTSNKSLSTPQKPLHLEASQLEHIFSSLSARCKQAQQQQQQQINQQQESEEQVLNIILENLAKLEVRKEYRDSVQLVRSIIVGIGAKYQEERRMIEIVNHSQMKKVGYMVAKDKECQGEESWQYCKDDSKKIDEDAEIADHSSSKFKKTPQPKSVSQSLFPYTATKHQGSIYIQDQSMAQGYISQQTSRNQNQHNSPNTNQNSMKSDSICKWPEESLYCIEEEQDQYQSSKVSENGSASAIPDKTIQFKKIIYMLESHTSKKYCHSSPTNSEEKGSMSYCTFSSQKSCGSAKSQTNPAFPMTEPSPGHIHTKSDIPHRILSESSYQSLEQPHTSPSRQMDCGNWKSMKKMSRLQATQVVPKMRNQLQALQEYSKTVKIVNRAKDQNGDNNQDRQREQDKQNTNIMEIFKKDKNKNKNKKTEKQNIKEQQKDKDRQITDKQKQKQKQKQKINNLLNLTGNSNKSKDLNDIVNMLNNKYHRNIQVKTINRL